MFDSIGNTSSFMVDVFECHVSFWGGTIPKGKACLPSIIFSVAFAVDLRGWSPQMMVWLGNPLKISWKCRFWNYSGVYKEAKEAKAWIAKASGQPEGEAGPVPQRAGKKCHRNHVCRPRKMRPPLVFRKLCATWKTIHLPLLKSGIMFLQKRVLLSTDKACAWPAQNLPHRPYHPVTMANSESWPTISENPAWSKVQSLPDFAGSSISAKSDMCYAIHALGEVLVCMKTEAIRTLLNSGTLEAIKKAATGGGIQDHSEKRSWFAGSRIW